MVCLDVGEANADVAGIGIVVAFIVQSMIAFVLSLLLDLILVDPHEQPSIYYRQGDSTQQQTVGIQDQIVLSGLNGNRSRQSISDDNVARQARSQKGSATAILNFLKDNSDKKELLLNSKERSPRAQFVRIEVRKIVAGILWTASDAQTLAGIALAITGIAQRRSLSLYQLHLIYDTINFTSITNCAAFAAASVVETSELLVRLASTALFATLYLAFTILFGIRLSQWDDSRPGFCYNTDGLAVMGASHPLVDNIYVAITCLYMYIILVSAWSLAISRTKSNSTIWRFLRNTVGLPFLTQDFSNQYTKLWFTLRTQNRVKDLTARLPNIFINTLNRILHGMLVMQYRFSNPLLSAALLQLPLHLYFIIRLRISNEPLLQNGSDENDWSFGQIFALVMSVGLIVECCKGINDYHEACEKWSRLSHLSEQKVDSNTNAMKSAVQGPSTTM